MSKIILDSLLVTRSTVAAEIVTARSRLDDLLSTSAQLDTMIVSLGGAATPGAIFIRTGPNTVVPLKDMTAATSVTLFPEQPRKLGRPRKHPVKEAGVKRAYHRSVPLSLSVDDLVEYAGAVLEERGPLPLIEIIGYLKDLGIDLGTTHGLKALRNAFDRTSSIKSLPRSSTFMRADYWLAGRALPDGYAPRENPVTYINGRVPGSAA